MMVAAWEDTAGAAWEGGGRGDGLAGAGAVVRGWGEVFAAGSGSPVRLVPGRVWWARVRRRRASRMGMRSRRRRNSAVLRQPSSAGDNTTGRAVAGPVEDSSVSFTGPGPATSPGWSVVSMPLASHPVTQRPDSPARVLALVVAASVMAWARVRSTAPAERSWRYSTVRDSSSTRSAKVSRFQVGGASQHIRSGQGGSSKLPGELVER